MAKLLNHCMKWSHLRDDLIDTDFQWHVSPEQAFTTRTFVLQHDRFAFAKLRALCAGASGVCYSRRPTDAGHCRSRSGDILPSEVMCKDDGF
jgi:hypothetical protein